VITGTRTILSPDRIALGETVLDLTTGFRGLATSRSELFNGNVQFGIQPRIKEGTDDIPNAIQLDHHLLEILDSGISERRCEPAATDIKVGDQVEDTVTGVMGTAITKTTFLNGCVYFEVQPRKGRLASAAPALSFIAHSRLRVVKTGDLPERKTDEPASGGPMSRVMRAR